MLTFHLKRSPRAFSLDWIEHTHSHQKESDGSGAVLAGEKSDSDCGENESQGSLDQTKTEEAHFGR
jgi:hypothetical protein